MVFWAAMGLYGLNLGVGAAAKWGGAKFGIWHHVLFAVVAAATLAAAVLAFEWGLTVTLAALATIPWISARSRAHPIIAIAGFLGYVAAALAQQLA